VRVPLRGAPAAAAARARGTTMRVLLASAVTVLFLLHNDVWLWSDTSLIFGLPIGLAYHIGYCFACAALMALLVRYGWPEDPQAGPDRQGRTDERR